MYQIASYFGLPAFIRSGKAHPPVHIGGYVPAGATQHTDQETNQMVYLFLPRP
jgi:hypothetical protein